jgi:hypothetical protein
MLSEVEPVTPASDDGLPEDDEGVLSIIDASVGDRKIKWNRKDPKSIAKAKKKFEELKAKGFKFFAVKRVGVHEFDEKGGEIHATDKVPEGPVPEFEPEARELVAVGQQRGG